MQVLEFFSRKKTQQTQSVQFAPTIQISPNSSLFVECTPGDPHTGSNIVVNSYQSKTNRTLLQTRIQWRRFKVLSENQHTNTYLPFITGNAYRCEPTDLGYYIQAKIISYDVACNGSAQVTIGPIKLDPTIKQLIQGALYSKSLRSQVKLIEKNQTRNIEMLLTDKVIKFNDEITNKMLEMPYDSMEPTIQPMPKDPTKIFLRFEQDHSNRVRQWIDSICQQEGNFDTQSKKSINSHGSSSSKSRVYKNNTCVNKMQIAFLTRHSRDQFMFAIRAFVCKQNMKNTAVMEAIQNVTEMKNPADSHKFFQYLSLKNQINRLAKLAKQFQTDRNKKVLDLQEAESEIGQITLTYLKIIQNKGKQLNVDFNQSYSEISIRRDEIMGKKQMRQLQTQNENLKIRIREMTEQLQLQKFFNNKKGNQSMMLNQTNNPFAKKQSGDSYYGPSMAYEQQEQKPPSQNVVQLSKSYALLLKQNEKLKEERRQQMGNTNVSKDIDMVNLLQSLHEQDQEPKVIIKKLKSQNKELKSRLEQSERMSNKNKSQLVIKLNQSVAYQQQQQQSIVEKRQKSFVSRNQDEMEYSKQQEGSFYSVNQSNINESMTSQAGMLMLQNKIKQIDLANKKILAENERLRKQRNDYRNLYEQSKKGGNITANQIQHRSVLSTSNYFDPDGLKKQNQNLVNQKNSLLKKIQSLTKQLTKGGDSLLQKKCQQLTKQNNYLKQQNESLKQKIQSIRNDSSSRINQSFAQNYKQNSKLKQINSQLLEEIKNLKLDLERKSNPIYNSRVIELQNEINYLKKSGQGNQGTEKATKQLIIQISNLQKDIQKLGRQNNDKEAKLQSQASLIERLMSSQQEAANSVSGKDKSYSQTRIDSQSNEKLKKKIKELQQQIVMMRRSADALNRSQDMSREMLNYNEQQMEIIKRQKQLILQENQRLAKMCQRYSKDAREANKQLMKWKQQAFDLKSQNNSGVAESS